MSATSLTVFDETIHVTNANDAIEALDWERRRRAYLGLRLTLQALRDSLTVEEAAQLATQLPMLIRGIYLEGWHPAHKAAKERDRDAFLKGVPKGVNQMPTDEPTDAGAVVQAAFSLLSRRLSDGGRGARRRLPEGLRELWPELTEAHDGAGGADGRPVAEPKLNGAKQRREPRSNDGGRDKLVAMMRQRNREIPIGELDLWRERTVWKDNSPSPERSKGPP